MKQITLTIYLEVEDVKSISNELAYEIDDFLTNQTSVEDWEIQFDTKTITEEN